MACPCKPGEHMSRARVITSWMVMLLLSEAAWGQLFDIAPFGRRCCAADRNFLQVAFDYNEAQHAGRTAERASDGRYIYGLQWAEERDINEVRVHFRPGSTAIDAAVEYWFVTWPYPPPEELPSIDDPVDDPWQGRWLKAATKRERQDATCRYRFLPLEGYENPNTSNLAGLEYRRTLKMRLVFASEPALDRVEVFTGSVQQPVKLRIELGAGETASYEWRGRIRVYNGDLTDVEPWNATPGDFAEMEHFRIRTNSALRGLTVRLVSAAPSLPGSHDTTIVTLEAGERTFSFAVPDVQKGPLYVPDFHAYVTLADGPHFTPSIVKTGWTVRERIPLEPEQTYERASKEIPPPDPIVRGWAGRLYLPLGADSSWQKFAFEWGGHITISKRGTKAKGAELRSLEWPEDRISWRIGTGSPPNFRPAAKDSKLSILENYLPIAEATWASGEIRYTEEAFATLLSGPLGPEDPARSEHTPSVLMVKITAHNEGMKSTQSQLWLATDPAEKVSLENGMLLEANRQLVRAHVHVPDSAGALLAEVPYESKSLHGIQMEIPLDPGQEKPVFIAIPFIPWLSEAERARLAELDYGAERARVVSYWRATTADSIPFEIPEKRFVNLAKANSIHVRISVTKDPKSGLYILPPASYVYDEYAHEAGMQAMALDALGDHARATRYLETLIRLQGSEPFPGTFTGDQRGVYYGTRVDPEYDYTYQHWYNLDHGIVLWALGEHYFFTRDKEWFHYAAPSMMRAADWIIEQRRLTQVYDGAEKAPEYGLLPAGHLEDNDDWANWFAVDSFAVAGMTRLAQALADVGAPESAHYSQEATAFANDLREAVRRASQAAPVTRLRDNSYVPYVPTKSHQRFRLFGPGRVGVYARYSGNSVLPLYRMSAAREVLYGPIILLITGVFHPEEPIAGWILDDWEDNLTMSTSFGLNVHGWVDDKYWFSRGGWVWEANIQNPILPYLLRHEVPAAVRNLYNDFASHFYADVGAFTEEYRGWGRGSGPFYKNSDELRFLNWLRDTLVLEDGDTLWLAPGAPRRWFGAGKKIEVHKAPTYFGPVTYRIEGTSIGVEADVELPTRDKFTKAWLVVRAPVGMRIHSVEIDGKPWQDFNAGSERIRIPGKVGPTHISVRY